MVNHFLVILVNRYDCFLNILTCFRNKPDNEAKQWVEKNRTDFYTLMMSLNVVGKESI